MVHRILISDRVHPACEGIFRKEPGFEVQTLPGLSPDELTAIIGAYDGLIARSTTYVTADVIQAAERLKVIGRTGVGVDNIDVQAATERGILVMNTPDVNTVATAEHTVALLLALARRITEADASVRSGEWKRDSFSSVELAGKTLGLIGLGRVGRQVAQRARAFDMHVVATDSAIRQDDIAGLEVTLVDLNDLLARSDFISLHVPLNDKTRHMIGEMELGRCKNGVYIVNCARGGVVDERALFSGLKTGKVAGAALDVFEQEPPGDSDLLELKNVIATPHIGGNAQGISQKAARSIAQQIIDYLKKGVIRNAVNAP